MKYFGSSFKRSAGWKVASSGVLLDSKPEKNRDPDQPQQSLGAHRALAPGLPGSWWMSSRAAGVLLERATRGMAWSLLLLNGMDFYKLPVCSHFSAEVHWRNLKHWKIFTKPLQNLGLWGGGHSKTEGQSNGLFRRGNIRSHCLGTWHRLLCCSLDYVEKRVLAYLAIVQILTCQKK